MIARTPHPGGPVRADARTCGSTTISPDRGRSLPSSIQAVLDHPIAPRLLGVIKRHVRRLQYDLRSPAARRSLRNPDTDGHGYRLVPFTLAGPTLALAFPDDAANHHLMAGDVLSKHLTACRRITIASASKEHREFLASEAICVTAEVLSQLGSNHTQYIVPDIVAVRIVELLEVVDVDHGHSPASAEPCHALVEHAPAGQLRERIEKGHAIACPARRHSKSDAGHHQRRVNGHAKQQTVTDPASRKRSNRDTVEHNVPAQVAASERE